VQASLPLPFSNKFMNKTAPNPVFMIEGRRVVAGEAVLSGASATDRNMNDPSDADRAEAESADQAVADLVREHSRLVYRISYAALRHHQDAEDATQETFLRVLRYRSKLGKVEDPKTWLARIAWRVAVERSKRRRTRESSLDDESVAFDVAASAPIANATVQQARIAATVEKLIEALPKKLRQPLVLSTIEEMSPREVAAVLGINESAVRSRLFRARKILKRKLSQGAGRKG
jgi:RNA polymerase sigma-70 factor (ECF subfamily)